MARVQITIRPDDAEYERLKAAHRASFPEHGRMFGAWAVAVLMRETERIEALSAAREEPPEPRKRARNA